MKSKLKIIAVGSSAGGLQALQTFLEKLPLLDNTCLIVAQHTSPDHKSRLVSLLQKATKYVVVEAENDDLLTAGKVYVTPPNRNIEINSGQIYLSQPRAGIFPKPSVDILLESLAKHNCERKIAVILSGTGSDGAQGALALKEQGGIILIQDTDQAQHSGMPLASLQTGTVDAELPVEQIGPFIQDLFEGEDTLLSEQDTTQEIIEVLDSFIDTDFSHYKRASVSRRLLKRVSEVGLDSLKEYLTYLKKTPSESKKLYESILIGVTSFFRDEEAFKLIGSELEQLVAKKTPDDPIRIWIPGCSTGEEVYSIAIIASEICEKHNRLEHLQIFGTDIDERAVRFARQGTYLKEALDGIKPALLEKYFYKQKDQYQADKGLRSRILFSRHDLISNAPFLRQDLISCRNLLIYFDQKLQRQVIPSFHYALNNGGVLFLGRSESIGSFAKLFEPIDSKNKIYRRRSGGSHNTPAITRLSPKYPAQAYTKHSAHKSKATTLQERIKDTLFSSFEHPYIVVNEYFEVLETHGDLQQFLRFPSGSINLNLVNLIHPKLEIELRAILTRAVKNNQATSNSIRPLTIENENLLIRLNVKPLIFKRDQESLFLVIIEKIKFAKDLKLITSDSAVEISSDAYRELESELAHTKESLQSYIEEIETSNEELQSLNEELQSTNEELETSNEELQSTTEEAQIAYSELQLAHRELEENEKRIMESEARSETLLNNELQAFILINTDHSVLKLNTKAIALFKTLYDVNIGLGDNLKAKFSSSHKHSFYQNIQNAIKGESYTGEHKLKAVNDQDYWMRFHVAPVFTDKKEVNSVSVGILDITQLKKTVSKLSYTEKLVNSVFDNTGFGICITDEKGNYVDANQAYCKIYGYKREELIGKHFSLVVPPEQHQNAKHLHNDFIAGKKDAALETEVVNREGALLWISESAQRLVRENGQVFKITSVQDITQRKELEGQREALRNGLPGVTWQYRLFADGRERLSAVSDGASALWGVSAQEAMEDVNRIWDTIHPDDLDQLRQQVDTSGRELSPLKIEFRLVQKDGKILWNRVQGNPKKLPDASILWSCIALDITKEKLIYNELEESERKLSTAAEIAKIGYWEIDTSQEPHALKWSKEHYKIWEWDPKQPSPNITSFLTTVLKDDYASFLAAYQKMVKEKVPFDWHYRIQVNGKTKWIHAKGLPDKERPEHYSGTAQDVTKEKLIYDELEESEAKLSQAVNIANIGYWEMNLKTKALSWSPQVFEILELDSKNFHPYLSSLFDIIHKDDLDKVEKAIAKAQQGISPYDIEYRVWVGPKIKWIHARGIVSKDDPFSFKGTVLDVTSQKEEETRLKLMESVVTNTSDPVMITTTQEIEEPDVQILFVNNAFTKMTGYSLEEVIGKSPKLLQGPKTDFNELRKMKQSMYQWQPYEITTINYKKDGSEFWNKFRIYPIKNNLDEYTHWVSIDQNVTDYKQRQKQHQMLNEISYLFNSLGTLQEVLETIVIKLVAEEAFEVSEIWLIDNRSQQMYLRAFTHEHEKYQAFHGQEKDQSLGRGIGLTGLVWKSKKPVLVRDLPNSKKYHRQQAAKAAGINTAYALPLLHANEVVGVLLLGTVKDHADSKPFDVLFENFTSVLGTEILRKKLEEDVRQIYNAAPDAISVSDFKGNILEINKTGADLLGYSQEELLSMNWLDLLHPEDRAITQENSRKHQQGIATKYTENRYVTKDGKVIWLAWTVKPDLKAKITFQVGKNITQEKELQLMLDNANRIAKMGAWKYEAQEDTFFYSAMTCKIIGAPENWSPKNLKEKTSLIVHEEDRIKAEQAFERALNKLEYFDLEFLNYNFSKTQKLWVRLIGEAQKSEDGKVSINGTLQDISQRKNAELMALLSLKEKEEILESIGDGFFRVDKDYRIKYWNQRATELMATQKEKVLGENLWKVFLDTEESEIHARYDKALATGTKDQFTYFYAHRNIYLDISIFPEKNKSLSVYFKDISQRMGYVKAIEDKNARLSQIAYTQSHIVRAPLARIMGIVRLMEEGVTTEAETKEFLDAIMHSSKELDVVIREIVELTQTLNESSND